MAREDANMTEKDRIRFESKFTKGAVDDCWIWNDACSSRGYGNFNLKCKTHSTHRLSYLLYKGPIPCKMHVCHSCDIKNCINPNHLWLGTAEDNMKDMHRKGRAPNIGEQHRRAKLKAIDIPVIRALRGHGVRNIDIAMRFRVDGCTITDIIMGRAWAHI